MKHRTFGRYEVLQRLGRGGMAEVYRAYHPPLDRYVAIKVLHSFLSDEKQFKARFEREAQNIAKLKHPNIVQVYDFDYEPESDSYYMVMELIDGPTLKDYLQDETADTGKLTLSQTIRTVRQAAEALAYAHQRGVIHRDVKTANLMLDRQENDRVVLTDFGIAKLVNSGNFTATGGGLIGTPAYMSPEQGAGEPGDERSDLYSLGVIMFQLLTGQLPFGGETPMAMILQHMNEPVPFVRTTEPHLPPAVDKIIQKLLAKSPDDRYQTAQDLLSDLDVLETAPSRLDPTTLILPKIKLPPVDDVKLLTTEARQSRPEGRRLPAALLLLIIGLFITIGGIYVGGAVNGIFPIAPLVGWLITETPTESPTLSAAETEVSAQVATPEVTEDAAAQNQVTAALTPATETTTHTPSPTRTPSSTPTLTPSTTPTNTPTPNATQTAAIERTATTAACVFDYAIISREDIGGTADGFFRVNSPYRTHIRIQNTGTCPWEGLASLEFVDGENFRASRFTILPSVEVGDDYTLEFEGITPSAGAGDEIITGRWQLKTKGQLPIGDPLTIGAKVYDPG